MWEIFADNTYLRATGNLVAVGTAIVLFYKSVRVGWGFFNTTIRSGVRAAIYRQKRRFYLTSYVCAFDVHVYISYVLRYMCLIFVLMFSIILFSNKNLKSEDEFKSSPPKFDISYENYIILHQYVDDVISAVSVVYLLCAFVMIVRVMSLSRNVQRLRSKKRKIVPHYKR